MSTQSLHDIQQTIDKLFERLDNAKTGGEISQNNHALRVQITKKLKLGAALNDREKDLVAAVGTVADKKSGSQLWIMILALAVIVGLYLAYKFLR